MHNRYGCIHNIHVMRVKNSIHIYAWDANTLVLHVIVGKCTTCIGFGKFIPEIANLKIISVI